MLRGEATNTDFIVFDLSRSGLKPMIYCTRSEHVNHYTIDAVDKRRCLTCLTVISGYKNHILWTNRCRINLVAKVAYARSNTLNTCQLSGETSISWSGNITCLFVNIICLYVNIICLYVGELLPKLLIISGHIIWRLYYTSK